MEEALTRAYAHEADLAELQGIMIDLLAICRLRRQTGPPRLEGMPTAPTVIDSLLWIPWVGGSGTYMISGLFGSGQGGSFTPQGTDGD